MKKQETKKEWRVGFEHDLGEVVLEIVPLLQAGTVIGLIGSLGAGKTTLVRALAAKLQVREPVSSPSYVLMHEYHIASGLLIEHWDVYRCKSLPIELIEPPAGDVVRLIEWSDKFEDLQEFVTAEITMVVQGAGERLITMTKKKTG